MAIPDFQVLMRPVLVRIQDGQPHRSGDLVPVVAEDLKLTSEDLGRLLPSGRQGKFRNRLHWAVFYMAKAGLIERPRRGWLQITARGLLITTSEFTSDASKYVKNIEKRIVLIDGQELADLMIEHGIGVAEVQIYTLKRLDSDYFEDETSRGSRHHERGSIARARVSARKGDSRHDRAQEGLKERRDDDGEDAPRNDRKMTAGHLWDISEDKCPRNDRALPESSDAEHHARYGPFSGRAAEIERLPGRETASGFARRK